MSEQSPASAPQRQHRRRLWVFALIIGASALFGFAAGKAHTFMGWHWAGHHGFDTEEITFIIQHRIDRALSKVDATQEQKDKIYAIAKAAVADVMALRKDQSDTPEKFVALLKADSIDRAAIEAMRSEKLKLADAVSKRILQAVADAAEVLKPEQRRQLADAWAQHHMHR